MFRFRRFLSLAALIIYIVALIAFVLSVAVLAVRAFVPVQNQPLWFSSAVEADPRIVPSLMYYVAWVSAMALLVDCYLLLFGLAKLVQFLLRFLRLPIMLLFAVAAAVAADVAIAEVYETETHPWANRAIITLLNKYNNLLSHVVSGSWILQARNFFQELRNFRFPAIR